MMAKMDMVLIIDPLVGPFSYPCVKLKNYLDTDN